jgi:predicted regulator of Ras-like GTPase activity (Roadblock/LC7/MglB family)
MDMFAITLKEIADRLDDVECILLMGTDGLPIEKVVKGESLNVELLTAEFTTILRNTAQTAAEVDAGALEEFILLTDRLIVLLKAITQEYFLMMILTEGANIGRARFELKKAKYVLEKEFV